MMRRTFGWLWATLSGGAVRSRAQDRTGHNFIRAYSHGHPRRATESFAADIPPEFDYRLLRMTPTASFRAAAVLALMFAVRLTAQDASPFRDLDRYAFGYAYPGSQLKDHIYERSRRLFAAGDEHRDRIGTADPVRQRQQHIRRVLIDGLGGLAPADTPLNARVTGTVGGDGFRIEKVIFESR